MKWLEPEPADVPEELQEAVGGHPLVAQALARRGHLSPRAALAFLDPRHYRPTPPMQLPDLERTVERLQVAIARGEPILVWGDFDVDGLTATALLVESLRELGALVEWYIPDRRTESHGVHWQSLQPFLGRGVRVLLTCDTGLSAREEVALAQNAGLDVLITDHHDMPPVLPQALAIVNPKRLPTEHPLRYLSGAGVAYKLAEALGMPDCGLDLVALGLVADVVPQVGEVRYLLQRGLQLLRQPTRQGLQALLEVAEISASALDEDDISYAVAPRLNALGRLADASTGVELFLTQDLVRARTIAAEMEALNVRRQFLSSQVTAAAQEQVQRDASLASSPVWVLAHPKWPAGVLGIAASRLAERYAKPVVLIATPPGQAARGSARSVPEVDIRAALAEHSRLLGSFGGHPMAAGFSIPAERIAELRSGLIRTVAEWVGQAPLEREISIDAYFTLPELDLALVDELSRLSPFGPGNPPLHLATRGLQVTKVRNVGRTGEHRRLGVQDEEGHASQALWWQSSDLPLPQGLFDLAYVLRANEFRGQRSLELEWVDARGMERLGVELAVPAVAVDMADYRALPEPLPALQALWDQSTMQLWAEAIPLPGFPASRRDKLRPGQTLVVWTVPPGQRTWEQALRAVQPEQVYLFAVDPQLGAMEDFMLRLAGLTKHALASLGGRLEWERLAAAMAHRVDTVQAGVRWLIARGQLSLVAEDERAAIVEVGGEGDMEAGHRARRELHELLRETAAYREYFRLADAASLFANYRPPAAGRQLAEHKGRGSL